MGKGPELVEPRRRYGSTASGTDDAPWEVIVVDDDREQERVATVYEPYPSEWTPDLRRRR